MNIRKDDSPDAPLLSTNREGIEMHTMKATIFKDAEVLFHIEDSKSLPPQQESKFHFATSNIDSL